MVIIRSILIFLLFSAHTLSANTLVIGAPLNPTPMSLQLEQLLKTAYLQLGYRTEFIALPSERRLRLLQHGDLDADLFRSCELDEAHPEFIVVPVTIGALHLRAYSLDPQKLTNWQQRPELIISHIRGFKMAEQQQFLGKRITVSSDQQAFGLMLQGRVDILLEDSHTAKKFLYQKKDLPTIAEQNVADFAVCHVLSNKQQSLLNSLTLKLRLSMAKTVLL
ncbi:hypothetical protein [Rheinheimera sp. D18]|uniref:hypothetical protein n=1 Tax=Rheinheimera sp. D18 TaxID=2545632 RepID=UPI001A9EC516|nr:hypothetical protein [Rheinheimera sp. D18]